MKIQLNKVYEFDLRGTVSFGPLTEDAVYNKFQDGRAASKFLELCLPIWFEDLEFVDQSGFDYVEKNTKALYELKGFTRNGADFSPSNMIGAGRKKDMAAITKHAHSMIYAISDIIDFPKIKLIFKTGAELLRHYPNAKIKVSTRNELFS